MSLHDVGCCQRREIRLGRPQRCFGEDGQRTVKDCGWVWRGSRRPAVSGGEKKENRTRYVVWGGSHPAHYRTVTTNRYF